MHDYRRRYANTLVLAALVSSYVVPFLGEDDIRGQLFQFFVLVSASYAFIPHVVSYTPIGELEGVYNEQSAKARAWLDNKLGDTASKFVPYLDTVARLGGAYIASSILSDDVLVKSVIATLCALEPAYSKYKHEQEYCLGF